MGQGVGTATAVLPSFATVRPAEGHWRRPFLRRNGPKTGGEGGRPHAPRRRDRMESKIASGVHAARQCGWRGSAGAAYLVWMPQLDGKGSPRGAVTGVERGSEVERVVIVHHTAVLACVCAEQRVLCSLVCRLWVCQGAVRARPRSQQRTWTGTAGTTNPPVYSTHRRCSTCRTLAASISPTTRTSRSLKRTTKLGLVHVGRLTVTHGRQRLN